MFILFQFTPQFFFFMGRLPLWGFFQRIRRFLFRSTRTLCPSWPPSFFRKKDSDSGERDTYQKKKRGDRDRERHRHMRYGSQHEDPLRESFRSIREAVSRHHWN